MNQAAIEQVLRQFPAGRQALAASPLEYHVVAAGAVNTIARVIGTCCDWAVRLGGAEDASLIVNRLGEQNAQMAAARLGLAPGVMYAEPRAGVLVSEWISAPMASPSLFASKAGLARVGRTLRVLHDAPLPTGLRLVDARAVGRAYLQGPRAGMGPVPRAAIEAAMGRVVAEIECKSMFCHNDLHYRNVLDDGRLWFVDWEYAGCGDPRFDLAGIVAYHDLETPLVEALLAAYGEYSPAQLAPWVSLFDAVHALWLDTADAWGSLSPERRSALVTRLMG